MPAVVYTGSISLLVAINSFPECRTPYIETGGRIFAGLCRTEELDAGRVATLAPLQVVPKKMNLSGTVRGFQLKVRDEERLGEELGTEVRA